MGHQVAASGQSLKNSTHSYVFLCCHGILKEKRILISLD